MMSLALLLLFVLPSDPILLVEAEQFDDPGGWVLDQQFMDQMGSPVLLAHGLGRPVKDATTTVRFHHAGSYSVWVRTRDWAGTWKTQGTPGLFQVLIDGEPLPVTFGTEDAEWHWQDGGVVRIDEGSVRVALKDLTGFDGRCDAILFCIDPEFDPSRVDLMMRRKLLKLEEEPEEAGRFDLVVVGGGMAGTCAAISAARLGLHVALVQDRPVLGGNNSSEVRVHLGGKIKLEPYPAVGRVVDELDPRQHGNARPAAEYKDQQKLDLVLAEQNIRLFLDMHANEVEMNGSGISAVIAQHVRTGLRLKFSAKLFADCTGDGTIGFLAGADYRIGREARGDTGESRAPEQADRMTMGASVMWYAVEENTPSTFPETPWAVQFTEETYHETTQGNWDWETGMNRHQVDEFETIRDYGLRAVFGNWSFLKSKKKYANHRLDWVAYIAGKRESRRLMGDVVLCQQDIVERKMFPDASVTTTWTIDLHYPIAKEGFEGEPYRSKAEHTPIEPYPIPYRCLYSRNVENLFMAGRNISVTHVALGTVRVMRTTGMMGEVAGMAASLCKRHGTTPRGVFRDHLEEFKALMKKGVP